MVISQRYIIVEALRSCHESSFTERTPLWRRPEVASYYLQ